MNKKLNRIFMVMRSATCHTYGDAHSSRRLSTSRAMKPSSSKSYFSVEKFLESLARMDATAYLQCAVSTCASCNDSANLADFASLLKLCRHQVTSVLPWYGTVTSSEVHADWYVSHTSLWASPAAALSLWWLLVVATLGADVILAKRHQSAVTECVLR